ncbi:SDR family NAD(P)-dependent oxidoreductase [Hymenobacter sp.]|jgi:NAD(P)-dependent dehydrogenase (short-subunit alcohol dehydrogenase family)|uniref:SDR family NAD(P)-dependent oxidoreductase n=1 Tax=Hymenobacter sp. TaxID=1898978 RepID=UPI002ED8A5F4
MAVSRVSSLTNKTALVTGASSGIGLVTARELARRGAKVILVARNREKLERARTAIQFAVPHAQLDVRVCDLSLLANVRQLADDLTHEYSKLDILVNNAGIMPGPHVLTSEGHELSWATNHLSVFALTHLLLPLLTAAETGRIVTVSSEAHWFGEIEFSQEVRNAPEKYSWLTAYADSKLANILFTNELAYRLELTTVTANCLHPGLVDTGLIHAHSPWAMKALWWPAKPFMVSPERGAETTLYLATAPEVAKVNGSYFKNSRPGRSSSRSQNRTDAARLWRISEEETGLAL